MKRVNLKLSIRVGKKRRGKRLLNNFLTLNSQFQVANKMLTIKIPYSLVRSLSKTKARPKDKGPNTSSLVDAAAAHFILKFSLATISERPPDST